MATTIADAYVHIIPVAEGIAGNLENLLGSESESAGMSAGSLFSEGFGGALGSITEIASSVISGLVSAVGNVGSEIASGISDVAQFGDNIDKLSQKMGISAKAYQEWDFIAQHSGTSMSALQGSFKTLSKQAQAGSDSFEKLGISLEDAASMSTEELFGAVVEGLQGMEEGTERTAIASQLLGRGATELGALLNTSAEDTEAMKQQVHDLGGVLSDEAVKDAAAYQDSLQNLNVSFEGLKNGLMADLMPGITQVMEGITSLVTGDQSGLKAISNGLTLFIQNMSQGFNDIIPVISSIVLSIGTAIIENAPMLIVSAGELIFQIISGMLEQLPSILEMGSTIIVQLAEGISSNIPTVIKTATQVLMDIVKELTNPATLVSIIQAGVSLITSLIDGILEAVPVLLENMPMIVDNVVTALIDCTPLIIEAGFQLLSALFDNLPYILELTASSVGSIVRSVISKLRTSGPDIVTAGYNLFMKIIQKIPAFIVEMKKSVKNILEKLVTYLKSGFESIKEVGKLIVDQLWNGIKGAWNEFVNKVKGLVTGLIDKMKGLFSDADYTEEIQTSLDVSAENATQGATTINAMTPYTGGDIAQDPVNGHLYNLLSEYLPEIASGRNNTVVLEGDADGLFNVVRDKNTLYTERTNYNPMVSG